MKRILRAAIAALIAAPSVLAADGPLVCRLPPRTAGLIDYFSPIIRLTLLPSGEMLWNGDRINSDTLQVYFSEFTQSDPQPILQLSVRDPNTPWHAVLPLLHEVQAHRLKYLWFETYRPGFAPPDAPKAAASSSFQKVQPFPFTVQCALWNDESPQSAPEITLTISPSGRPMRNGKAIGWDVIEQAITKDALHTPQPAMLIAPARSTPFISFTELLLNAGFNFQRVQISLDGDSPPSK